MADTADRRPKVKKVLVEAVLVAVIGIALAFAANSISPRGLVLTRNYFPEGTNGSRPTPTGTGLPHSVAGTNPVALSTRQLFAARINDKGLQLIDGRQAADLFHDPRFQQETIVFIDARDDGHYQEGHIPGAYPFDPYHPEKYLATALPVCRAAEQIVVYCIGSDCEDSQFAALTLRDAGIANQKLLVYAGGITEWTTNGLPLEIGARQSGNLRNPAK